MKKSILVLASLVFIGVQAQETAGYNKWSVDLNGGVNKPITPFKSTDHLL